MTPKNEIDIRRITILLVLYIFSFQINQLSAQNINLPQNINKIINNIKFKVNGNFLFYNKYLYLYSNHRTYRFKNTITGGEYAVKDHYLVYLRHNHFIRVNLNTGHEIMLKDNHNHYFTWWKYNLIKTCGTIVLEAHQSQVIHNYIWDTISSRYLHTPEIPLPARTYSYTYCGSLHNYYVMPNTIIACGPGCTAVCSKCALITYPSGRMIDSNAEEDSVNTSSDGKYLIWQSKRGICVKYTDHKSKCNDTILSEMNSINDEGQILLSGFININYQYAKNRSYIIKYLKTHFIGLYYIKNIHSKPKYIALAGGGQWISKSTAKNIIHWLNLKNNSLRQGARKPAINLPSKPPRQNDTQANTTYTIDRWGNA